MAGATQTPEVADNIVGGVGTRVRREKLPIRPAGMELPAPPIVNDDPLLGSVNLGWLRQAVYSIGRAVSDSAIVEFTTEQTNVK
jgi:hypothetical protein